MNFLDNFKLKGEKEDFQTVISNIDKGVVFTGTNLWILVFAIFIASLGLNVNSTAVIIGAMLVSPLMGPIMGLGLGMAINDLTLLRKSLSNYLFAAGIGLATSTIYFLLSPINDAHSEILARTSPNIYDVLIAWFGGLAGILATSSKQKGNVIPGVAIATALMPPLCTAGYGLATLNFNYFFGAFYLFLINTVFIALATLVTARFLKFPFKHLLKEEDEKKAQRIVWIVVLITLLPSIYFGYDIVQRNKFEINSNNFVEYEAIFPNDFLLKKNIDAKNRTITLTYGGQFIEEKEIQSLKSKLKGYNLDNTTLEIRQGFAYLQDNKDNDESNQLTLALNTKEKQIQTLRRRLDSLDSQKQLSKQIYDELKAQYPPIQSCVLQPAISNTDTTQNSLWVSVITSKSRIVKKERFKIEQWLKVRLKTNSLLVYFN
ncbi:MAG: TIGR00341 family protein [Bacteroidetes bacterium]|nr:TIGR00341 family protein [Bacteroidota bacterium]